ncbi:MAG: hypothetical protein HKM23_05865 [Nitrosopumilus sp.]|nr:hypothetical protein [Nitrosopumilus sp.]
MTILGTGVTSHALVDAYAYPTKADNSEKLKAKSFGLKTKDKIPFSDPHNTKQNLFDSVKKEQVKTYKKIIAEYNAKQLLKDLYKLK